MAVEPHLPVLLEDSQESGLDGFGLDEVRGGIGAGRTIPKDAAKL